MTLKDVLVAGKMAGNGGGGGGANSMAVTYSLNGMVATLDKTWNEINTAFRTGVLAYFVNIESDSFLSVGYFVGIFNDGAVYNITVDFLNGDAPLEFWTDSADGYPVHDFS